MHDELVFLDYNMTTRLRCFRLEVLTQLTNVEIARSDVVTWIRTQDLTVVCEFNLSGLPLHLRPKKKVMLSLFLVLNLRNRPRPLFKADDEI